MKRVRAGLLGAAAGLAVCAGSAEATWSIILVDTRTGEIAVGSATCLTGFDLKANTPVLIQGVGAATAQSFVDSTGQNRVFVRDRLLEGVAPDDILVLLSQFDPGHQTRQYGIVDVLGRAATFSGASASQWKGGQIGMVGDIAYAIQGNILTGEPVVSAAVDAVVNTPGDLAEKLMAAMQAARSMGGDGRCSCPGNPTGCGSPPPNFTKSAHIAYMLIARAGDTNGCNGIYRASGAFLPVARDLDGDGLPEVVCSNITQSTVLIFPNTTGPSGLFVTLGDPVVVPNTARSRGVAVADVTGDAVPDVVTANSLDSSVSVIPGLGGMSFGQAVQYATGPAPERVLIADFDGQNGPDIASYRTGGDTYLLLSDGAGGFGAFSSITSNGNLWQAQAVDIDGDTDVDIVYTARDLDAVVVLVNDGSGNFSVGPVLGVSDQPREIAVGDFDDNGEMDIAVTSFSQQVLAVLMQSGGVFTRVDTALGAIGVSVASGDLNGDAWDDLLVTRASAAGNFLGLVSNGDGTFTEHGATTGMGGAFPVLADLDNDGEDDALATLPSTSVLIVQNKGGGALNDGQGCATGDWFMDFNIANQQQSDPDPVEQLQGLFDQWRQDLIGLPDAVQSVVTLAPGSVAATGHAKAVMRIELNDWQGQPITASVSLPVVVHAPGSAGLSAIGPVTPLGGGVFEVELTPAPGSGVDAFVVTVDDGVRPVVLMPDPELVVTCYADCDGSGALNVFDYLCFVNAFNAGNPSADCDGSGSLDLFDFLCFGNAFTAGCP